MKNSLELLFGSRERWRLIKFFILNEGIDFLFKEIVEKNKLNNKKAKTILTQLTNSKFVVARSRGGKKYYQLNTKFVFLGELRKLVVRSNIFPQCDSLSKVKKLGDVKLAVVSGIFINYPKSKTDILIVADSVSKAKMKHLIEDLEAEMSREVNYSLMGFDEFKYRVNMFDKFIMELLEAPHEIIVNKIQGLLSNIQRGKRN